MKIEISSQSQDQAQHTADNLKQLIEERLDSIEEDLQILGPAPCPVWKLRNRFRIQIVLKTAHRGLLQSLGEYLLPVSYTHLDVYKRQVQILGQPVLDKLCQEGIIIPVNKYGSKRLPKDGWVYRIIDTSVFELDKIRKRAPRQAEILEKLRQAGEIDCRKLEESFALSSIRSLEKQGFIERHKKQPQLQAPSYGLSFDQEQVVNNVQAALRAGKFKEFLLHGVTGSGKTEVYINCVLEAIANGLQTIVLVPEIALTEHLITQFAARVPDTAILHSGCLLYTSRCV